MIQEPERGLGSWHAEWEVLPELTRLAGGAVHHLVSTLQSLEIDASRMRKNLDATSGLIFAEAVSAALASRIGRSRAHESMAACSRDAIRTRQHLRKMLEKDDQVTHHLSPEELEKLFEPAAYAGSSAAFIEQVVSSWSK